MAAPALRKGFERKFDLDSSILPDGAASSITVSVSTDADVVLALADNKPFPKRESGVIPLSGVAFALDSGKDLKFKAGKTNVKFQFSASVNSGVGIYDDASQALKALNLQETPGIKFAVPDDDSTRLALVRLGYAAEGKVQGTHPIGTLGSLTFGAEGASSGLYGILHRFPATNGAFTVLKRTVDSFRLPRHVGLTDTGEVNIAPGTWVMAEVEGSLSVKVGATLGYNFNFIHEAKIGGLTGDIGLKIDAGLKATFGFDVSGKFLAIVGRESTDSTVRLQLFKQKKKGMDFGLNLKVGVTGVAEIPEGADDFLQAVFGVHGIQVAKALRNVDKWTDKKNSIGDLVAGLANDQALNLLKTTTGVDPSVKFEQAKQKFLSVLDQWDELPNKVSLRLWKRLDQSESPAFSKFVSTLEILADPKKTASKLKDLIGSTGLTDRIEGEWLNALTERGILALMDELDLVQDAAQKTLGALQGDVLKKLKTYLDKALALDQVRKATTDLDFKKIDAFLVGRLALFLDRELNLQSLNDLKNAINMITGKRQEIYEKARKALNNTYAFELTAAYHKATTTDALIDAEFDLSKPKALALFTEVMQDAALDRLLVEPTNGVRLNQGVMSHAINRSSFIEVNMPMFSFRRDHQNNSLATVRAQDLRIAEEAGRVLIYDVNASDQVTVRNQYRSRLSMALSNELARSATVRVDSVPSSTWSYRLLHAKPHMKREEIEGFARPFIEEYMPGKFANGTDLSTFFTMFDATVEEAVENGKNEFGDVLTSMEVTIPGEALRAWFAPMTKSQRRDATMRMSRAIQAGLKRLLPFYYFQDVDRLRQNSTAAALLVWAAIRPSTSVNLDAGRLIFDTGEKPYWNFSDLALRRAMANNPDTAARLVPALLSARLRLLEAGQDKEASFFVASEAADFLSAAVANDNPLFNGLVFFEAQIVEKAAEALDDLAGIVDVQEKSPSKAIERLAEFGSDITSAFHEKLKSVYADKSSLRALGQVVFLEASKALAAGTLNVKPRAMITMTVLGKSHQFDMPKFLDGELPEPDQIVVEQRLVNV